MGGVLARLRAAISLRGRVERRQADALARKLGVSREDATRILRRSHQVGFGAAMLEEERAGRSPGRHGDAPRDASG